MVSRSAYTYPHFKLIVSVGTPPSPSPSAANCAENRPAYFASRLRASMKGLGTNDDDLVRLVVGRAEVRSLAR